MSNTVQKLRPAKIRSAVRRRRFEWALGRLPIEPGPQIVEIGSSYGGWRIPEGVLTPGQICYCVGSGDDISFDLELIRRYGASVRAVDPVDIYERRVLEAAAGEPRFTFRRAAVTTSDGPVRMQTHHEADSESLSAAGIDLLKLDVEGIEYELLPTLDLVALGVTIFSIQLHHTGTVRQALNLVAAVRRQGFRLVAQRPVVKLTFYRSADSPAQKAS
jgi:hypothetical protein